MMGRLLRLGTVTNAFGESEMNNYANPEVLLNELTEVSRAIDQVADVLKLLAGKRDAIFSALDDVTKPVAQQHAEQRTRIMSRGYVYHGHFTYTGYLNQLYCWLLNQLLTDYPEKAEAVADAMARYGTNRTYLAKQPEQLFTGKPIEWVSKYSKKLRCGWYVDTNLNLERMRRLIPVAMKAAGLEWGKDVRVFWSRTTISDYEARKLGI